MQRQEQHPSQGNILACPISKSGLPRLCSLLERKELSVLARVYYTNQVTRRALLGWHNYVKDKTHYALLPLKGVVQSEECLVVSDKIGCL